MIFFRRNENETVEKIKFNRFVRGFQLLLWVLLILVFTRGVWSFIEPDKTSSVKAYMQNDLAKQRQRSDKELGVGAFAKSFAMTFMQYDGDDDSYKNQLARYVSPNMAVVDKKVNADVIYVSSYKNTWITDDKVLVDCEIVVKYSNTAKPKNTDASTSNSPNSKQNNQNNQSSQETTTTDEQTTYNSENLTAVQTATSETKKLNTNIKSVFLRVPVSIKEDGGYIIESYPTFISSSAKSTQNNQTSMPGDKVENSEEEKVKEVIKSFLSAYCDGKETDLKYYMLKGSSKLKALGNNFKFVDIDKFDLKKKNDKYNVNAVYKVEDVAGVFHQQMQFVMIYKDGKYVIESLNTVIK